jgi:protein involved in polysaccharide export with SLBB domain
LVGVVRARVLRLLGQRSRRRRSRVNEGGVSAEQCLNQGAIQSAAPGQASADPRNYHIQPGDQLESYFYLDPEFNDEVTVGPDGKINMRMLGSLAAAGMTPSQLAEQVASLRNEANEI